MMSKTLATMIWVFAVSIASAAATVPDGARLHDARAQPEATRIVGLSLRFKKASAVCLQALRHDWFASVHKGKDDIYTVELAAGSNTSMVSQIQDLLSFLVICPEMDDDYEYRTVEFVDGEILIIVSESGHDHIGTVALKKTDLKLTIEFTPVAAH